MIPSHRLNLEDLKSMSLLVQENYNINKLIQNVFDVKITPQLYYLIQNLCDVSLIKKKKDNNPHTTENHLVAIKEEILSLT